MLSERSHSGESVSDRPPVRLPAFQPLDSRRFDIDLFVIVGVVVVYSFLPRILSNFPRAKLGGAVFADVTSANVVGYTTREFPAGYRLVGFQFESPDGTRNINDLIPYKGGSTITWSIPSPGARLAQYADICPLIQIAKTGQTAGYTSLYYVTNAKDGDNYVEGWSDSQGNYVKTDTIIPGIGAWFRDTQNTDPSITLSGSVFDGDFSIECPAGYRLRAVPCPIELCLNDATKVTFTGLDNSTVIPWSVPSPGARLAQYAEKCPLIQVGKVGKNESGYTSYYYVSNAKKGSEYVEGWSDSQGNYATDTIPLTAGFWSRGNASTFYMIFKPVIK